MVEPMEISVPANIQMRHLYQGESYSQTITDTFSTSATLIVLKNYILGIIQVFKCE